MEEKELLGKLGLAIIEGDSEGIRQLVQESIDKTDPLQMVEKGMMPGLTEVGNRFSQGKVFLPELLMAAETFEEAMKIIKPRLEASGVSRKTRGIVVIGTVQTDIHEIGKNVLINLLTSSGFEVHDIGIDAPASKFIARAEEVGADIIAASAIMSTTMPYQKDIIDSLDSKGISDKYIVMVGGGVVTQEWADKIGADGYAELASDAVELAKKLIAKKKGA